jgi:glycerol uptake facilitator-like aquaporin
MTRIPPPQMARRLFAEALGSILLTATVVGSGIMAHGMSPANDAVALLGNTLATAAILFVLITGLGPLSGAHFNPAVTLVTRLRGEIGTLEAAAYCLVQIVGCILGAMLAHALFEQPLIQMSAHVRSGPAQVLSESAATFALVLTILMVSRQRPQDVPVAVALVITAGYWWTSSTSFANPAITIARSMSDSFAGIRPNDVPGFILGQLLGALLAMLANRGLYGSR